MLVDMVTHNAVQFMGPVAVTLPAIHPPFAARNRQALPRDAVRPGFVAILAAHVQLAHMDVELVRRVAQGRLQIAVLGVRSAAAVKVTGAACPAGRSAHLLRRLHYVHLTIRHAAVLGILSVGAACVVTDKAIYIIRICEVEPVIPPAVTDVTLGATLVVGGGVNAITVQNGLFSEISLVFMSLGVWRRPVPVPVGGLENVIPLPGVALKTDACDNLRLRVARDLDMGRMVGHMTVMAGNAVRRRILIRRGFPVTAYALPVKSSLQAGSGRVVGFVRKPVAGDAGVELRVVNGFKIEILDSLMRVAGDAIPFDVGVRRLNLRHRKLMAVIA